MKLSILIPTIVGREKQYNSLIGSLEPQLTDEIEICVLKDNKEMTIGAKRNILLQGAEGEYISFIDDDDKISAIYISLLLQAIDSGYDCASLKGQYYFRGRIDGMFEHSLRYKEWKTNTSNKHDIKYERYPNHLNCIKSYIAKQFKFEEINHGEDYKWAKQIHESGLLKTEFYIAHVIYYYYKS
jgi:hypothetical protein